MASSRQDKEVDGPWDSEEEGEIICEAHIKRQIKSDAEQPIVSPKFWAIGALNLFFVI